MLKFIRMTSQSLKTGKLVKHVNRDGEVHSEKESMNIIADMHAEFLRVRPEHTAITS